MICGKMVVEFSSMMEAQELMEDFNELLVKRGKLTLTNVDGEQAHLSVDHHEVVLLFDEDDEQAV